MIIKFSNLGLIKETELDLRPLTVIIGPNNSNKTYIAYSIYGMCKQIGLSLIDLSDKLDIKLVGENKYALNLDDDLIKILAKGYEQNVKLFKNDLESFFQDSTGQLFKNTNFGIKIDFQEVRDALNALVAKGKLYGPDEGAWDVYSKDNVLFIELKTKILAEDVFPADKELIALIFIGRIRRLLFSSAYIFPAERNAFILTYKMLAARHYQSLKETQRELFSTRENREKQLEVVRELSSIRFPKPADDFLSFLSEIEQHNIRIDSKNKSDFQKLADSIEQHIQSKNKTSLKQKRIGSKELTVNVRRGLNIDLYNASSSIKQLAPILLYLRYQAFEGDLLIIDEPEMNLHPESQAKFLEALAILVNLGVKVLLTTHSPYFMAHLNNLVNGKVNSPTVLKRQASSLYLKDSRAFLSPDKVSAYEMKDYKLVDLKDENYGIRWDTLSDVSADLQQKYFDIYEKGKAKPRAKKKQ